MTLTEFLLARIAEDEAVARASTGGSWSWEHEDWSDLDATDLKYGCVEGHDWGHHGPDLMSSEPDPEFGGASVVLTSTGYDADQVIIAESDGRHIARHDPARVLRECEAKRRIVKEFTPFATATPQQVYTSRLLFSLLALPYDDHPDYREEWKP